MTILFEFRMSCNNNSKAAQSPDPISQPIVLGQTVVEYHGPVI